MVDLLRPRDSYDKPACTCRKSRAVRCGPYWMRNIITDPGCTLHGRSRSAAATGGGLPGMTLAKMRAWCNRTYGGEAAVLACAIHMMRDPAVSDVGRMTLDSLVEMRAAESRT